MDISLFLYLDGTKDDQSFYLSSFKYTVNSPMENLFIKTAKNEYHELYFLLQRKFSFNKRKDSWLSEDHTSKRTMKIV